jgi:two-component system chemotaxis response regulator CheB
MEPITSAATERTTGTIEAVVIGCSAGGLKALYAVLAGLDEHLPVPVIVVIHSGSDDVGMLCNLLSKVSQLPVEEALERRQPRPGCVFVAPTGYHLYIERDGRFALSVDDKVCFVRPSIDVLFESAADVFREQLVAVVMTGSNEDGAAGLRAVRARGAIGIVQDPEDAEAPAMPAAALKLAGADYCVPLAGIARLINELCRR